MLSRPATGITMRVTCGVPARRESDIGSLLVPVGHGPPAAARPVPFVKLDAADLADDEQVADHGDERVRDDVTSAPLNEPLRSTM